MEAYHKAADALPTSNVSEFKSIIQPGRLRLRDDVCKRLSGGQYVVAQERARFLASRAVVVDFN